jgi:DNA-binding transcriptional MerR regulator
MKTPRIKKLYHSISEVSELTGLEPHVLRYWETEFPQLRPRKNRAGNRTYSDADLALVERIRHLLREERDTLEGARRALQRQDAAPATAAWRDEMLRLRSFLAGMRERLGESSE